MPKIPLTPIVRTGSFSVSNGNRGFSDKILFYRGTPITIAELGEAVAFLYRNEERIYPKNRGFKGGEMLRNFLNECMTRGRLTPDLLKKYGLGYRIRNQGR